MNEQKYLYVVFLKTETTVGKIVRMATHHEYNHVALSFCPALCKMFSFARYKKESPLVGGFVCERPSRYLYPDNDAKAKICRLPLEEDEFESLKKRMARFSAEGKKMRYNSIDALAIPLGHKIKIKHTYTCLSFAAESLGLCVDSIKELEDILQKYVIYEGSLGNYLKKYDLVGLDYFEPKKITDTVCDTAKHFGILVKRLFDH